MSAELERPRTADPMFYAQRPMNRRLRIDFVLYSYGSVKMFEPTLRLLAGRGHEIRLVIDRLQEGQEWARELVDRLRADFPSITVEHLELPDEWHPWTRLYTDLARSLDYVRYFHPHFRRAEALRDRARRKAPALTGRVMTGHLGRTRRGPVFVRSLLRGALAATPAGPGVRAWVRDRRPDVLLLSPLIDGRRQPEFLRAAREEGVPVVACVRSWDNLTTKGEILEPPDRVTVWNETMRQEAIDLHDVPGDRVVTTGAQSFDIWFDRGPSKDRETFLSELGLDPAKPYLLYLCSSKFISGEGEPDFVARWMAQVRAQPAMDGIGVLVRPHPKSGKYWREVDLGPNTVVFPQVGSETDTPQAQDIFFDSIFHSKAVVGVNTSALIESAIVGRPVLSVLADEFKKTQEDSIHFSYLRSVGGGALTVDETMDAHVARLGRIVQGTEEGVDPSRFVREFVRPHGLDKPAAPILADALEEAATLHPERRREPAWAPAARPLLAVLAGFSLVRARLEEGRRGVLKLRRRAGAIPARVAQLASRS